MIDAKVKSAGRQFSSSKLIIIVLVPIFLAVLGMYAYNVFRATQSASIQQTVVPITQSTLEEQYGLRVNLVAVTAAGGLVDVRLKMVDGEKAKSLLQDPKNYPALWIAEGNVTLAIPEENRGEEIQFEDDGNLFLMFPNARGIVKPGTPVIIRFGETQLKPILAK